MNAAWIGVVGAIGGGLVGVLGTWLAQQGERSEANRSVRRDAYANFLEDANRGIRTVQSLRRYEGWIDAACAATEAGEVPEHLPGHETLEAVRAEADSFVNGLDRSLALVQLVAPVRILEAARHLHDGIYNFNTDKISSTEISDRFKSFAALAHADLRYRGLAHRTLRLNRRIGIPIRDDTA